MVFVPWFLHSIVPSGVIQFVWPAVTLTVQTNALYFESVLRQEQHSSGITNDYVKNIAFIHVYFFELIKSTRHSCLRLDSRYNISLFNSNHFYRWHI